MDGDDDCDCIATTIVSTITGARHGSKTLSLRPTQTQSATPANLVTVVVQVDVFPTGISLVSPSSMNSSSFSTITISRYSNPSSTSNLTQQPFSTQNVRLISPSGSPDAPSTGINPANRASSSNHAIPITGAIIGGLAGLALLVAFLTLWAASSKRKRNKDTLDSSSPSLLFPTLTTEQTHTWPSAANQTKKLISMMWYNLLFPCDSDGTFKSSRCLRESNKRTS